MIFKEKVAESWAKEAIEHRAIANKMGLKGILHKIY